MLRVDPVDRDRMFVLVLFQFEFVPHAVSFGFHQSSISLFLMLLSVADTKYKEGD